MLFVAVLLCGVWLCQNSEPFIDLVLAIVAVGSESGVTFLHNDDVANPGCFVFNLQQSVPGWFEMHDLLNQQWTVPSASDLPNSAPISLRTVPVCQAASKESGTD